MKSKIQAERVESMSNVGQIGEALFRFEEEYGEFPSDELATEEAKFAGLTGVRVLDQLEAAELLPDVDRMLAVGKLCKGDWLYFPGVSTSSDSNTPVLISPEIDGKWMILRVDGSTTIESGAALKAMDLSNAVAIPALPKPR